MENYRLTGHWIGSYTYGIEDDFNYQGVTIPFKLNLICHNGQLSGTCIDAESEALFSEPATINGTFDGHLVSFIKRYPSAWGETENGTIETAEDEESQEIHYFGELTKSLFRMTFDGEWTCSQKYLKEDGKKALAVVSGTWTMTKQ